MSSCSLNDGDHLSFELDDYTNVLAVRSSVDAALAEYAITSDVQVAYNQLSRSLSELPPSSHESGEDSSSVEDLKGVILLNLGMLSLERGFGAASVQYLCKSAAIFEKRSKLSSESSPECLSSTLFVRSCLHLSSAFTLLSDELSSLRMLKTAENQLSSSRITAETSPAIHVSLHKHFGEYFRSIGQFQLSQKALEKAQSFACICLQLKKPLSILEDIALKQETVLTLLSNCRVKAAENLQEDIISTLQRSYTTRNVNFGIAYLTRASIRLLASSRVDDLQTAEVDALNALQIFKDTFGDYSARFAEGQIVLFRVRAKLLTSSSEGIEEISQHLTAAQHVMELLLGTRESKFHVNSSVILARAFAMKGIGEKSRVFFEDAFEIATVLAEKKKLAIPDRLLDVTTQLASCCMKLKHLQRANLMFFKVLTMKREIMRNWPKESNDDCEKNSVQCPETNMRAMSAMRSFLQDIPQNDRTLLQINFDQDEEGIKRNWELTQTED